MVSGKLFHVIVKRKKHFLSFCHEGNGAEKVEKRKM